MANKTERDMLEEVMQNISEALYRKFEMVEGGVLIVQLTDGTIASVFGSPKKMHPKKLEAAFEVLIEELKTHKN